MDLQKTLNEIFCEVFDDSAIIICTNTTANDIDGWDSLSHVNLIVMIEQRFKIRFTQRELLTLKNVGDLLKIIDAKLGAGQA